MPTEAFVGQFYGCMREVDRASGGFFSAAKEESEAEPEPDSEPAADEDDGGFPTFENAGNNWAEDMEAEDEEAAAELEKCDTFLDIGCAPVRT